MEIPYDDIGNAGAPNNSQEQQSLSQRAPPNFSAEITVDKLGESMFSVTTHAYN